MRDLIVLLVHLITTVFRLARPRGLRSVVAESVLIKHQLLIVSRSREAPQRPADPKQRWMTFVRNHAKAIIASDFFVVVTACQ